MGAELVQLDATGGEQTVGDQEDFLTTRECAARLHVTGSTLGAWAEAGKIPFIQFSRKKLWHWATVKEALLRAQRGGII
jgi:excisionase family DNA binding protein